MQGIWIELPNSKDTIRNFKFDSNSLKVMGEGAMDTTAKVYKLLKIIKLEDWEDETKSTEISSGSKQIFNCLVDSLRTETVFITNYKDSCSNEIKKVSL